MVTLFDLDTHEVINTANLDPEPPRTHAIRARGSVRFYPGDGSTVTVAADRPSGRAAVHVDWGAEEVWAHQAEEPPRTGRRRAGIPSSWRLDDRGGIDTVVDQDGAVHIGPIVVPAWLRPGQVRREEKQRVRVQFEQRTASVPAGFRPATVYLRDATGRITGDPLARVWVAWSEPGEAAAVPSSADPTATGAAQNVPDLQQSEEDLPGGEMVRSSPQVQPDARAYTYGELRALAQRVGRDGRQVVFDSTDSDADARLRQQARLSLAGDGEIRVHAEGRGGVIYLNGRAVPAAVLAEVLNDLFRGDVRLTRVTLLICEVGRGNVPVRLVQTLTALRGQNIEVLATPDVAAVSATTGTAVALTTDAAGVVTGRGQFQRWGSAGRLDQPRTAGYSVPENPALPPPDDPGPWHQRLTPAPAGVVPTDRAPARLRQEYAAVRPGDRPQWLEANADRLRQAAEASDLPTVPGPLYLVVPAVEGGRPEEVVLDWLARPGRPVLVGWPRPPAAVAGQVLVQFPAGAGRDVSALLGEQPGSVAVIDPAADYDPLVVPDGTAPEGPMVSLHPALPAGGDPGGGDAG